MTYRSASLLAIVAALGAACHNQPVYRLQPQCPAARDTFRIDVQAQGIAAVSGVVTNRDTGTPVSEALITLSPTDRRQLTDSLGRFALDSVRPGQYVVSIRRIGYARRNDNISVSTGSALALRLPLEPAYVERCPTVERVRVR